MNCTQNKMQTILDFAKEIVDEIYKHDEHWNYNILIEPNEIQLVTKNWDIVHTIMFSNSAFNVTLDYGYCGDIDDSFETVKDAIDFIFD